MSGTIRKRGANSWQVRVSLGQRDPQTGRWRYVERHLRGTKRDAQRALDALSVEVTRGSHRTSGRRTVNDLLDAWIIHLEAQGRADSTLVRYRSANRANISPHLGRLDITRIGPAELDRFYGQLGRTGLKPLSIRKSHAMLSAAFNQAVKWGWVDTNPVLRSSPPTQRVREIHPPTQEELRCLLEACANDHQDLGSLIYVAATTGARRGELCGLCWSDIDFDLATLTIARSISDANHLVAIKDTKTHQARRIALDPSTVDVLQAHRDRVDERAAMAGVVVSPAAYVWSQDLDAATPYRPDRVTGAFRTLRDRLELSHITFHSLRHFTATTLAGGGVGIRTIAGRLGHANPGITLRTYAHFLDAADREAATAIGDAMAGLQPASANRSKASTNARRGTTSRRPKRTEGSSRLATKS